VRIAFSFGWKALAIAFVVSIMVLAGAWEGAEYYTSQSSFCGGSCHIMDEQFQAWKDSKHYAPGGDVAKQASCIECHFLPGEKRSMKVRYEGLRHLFAYLYDRDAPLPIRPVIKDGACLRSGCHAKEKFQDEELKFTEKKVRFKHRVHLEDKALEGQTLTCDTCHFKVTTKKHFEVPKDICYLCHLKLEKPTLGRAVVAGNVFAGNVEKISFTQEPSIDFNQGLSKCDICHTIPTESLQSQLREDDLIAKPITHQTIQKAGVACEGCHFEVVKGAGEIETGNVVSNGCLTCHNRSQELLAKASDGKLMHDEHIAKRKADCFDCHNVIEHRNRTDHLDFVRNDCSLCHQDQHKYQKLLLAGTPINENLSTTPHLMFEVNTNCMGCHLKKAISKGYPVRTGAPETCVACHTPQHRKMLDDWKQTLEREVAFIKEVETEALAALAAAEGRFDAEKLNEARETIAVGQELLNIVRFGNGVHNKKYAIMILDEAIVNFEDTIDLLDLAQ
jgi:nitrate/TMAO reductase-like tetraheme cytochrome c subunit